MFEEIKGRPLFIVGERIGVIEPARRSDDHEP
jgi:hypothetical protein